ncbi:MAG: folate-binding protein [Terricaulis silvestris]
MAGPYRLDRALLRVSGPDAREFLQNLLTQDLVGLDAARVLYAGLLTPQGKVLADMSVWADADGAVIIETDPKFGPDLTRRLAMYKLRADVDVADISEQRHILFAPTQFDGAVPDPRFPGGQLGWRKIDAGTAPPGAEIYTDLRLALGAPELSVDAQPEEVFALEALFEELHGVDFQKGCFVGQENVSRMKRRATTRKKFCPIVFDGSSPAPGAAITAGAAELGTARSGVQGRAMALLRLDRALEAREPLVCESRSVRLDPPAWLILPPRAEETR